MRNVDSPHAAREAWEASLNDVARSCLYYLSHEVVGPNALMVQFGDGAPAHYPHPGLDDRTIPQPVFTLPCGTTIDFKVADVQPLPAPAGCRQASDPESWLVDGRELHFCELTVGGNLGFLFKEWETVREDIASGKIAGLLLVIDGKRHMLGADDIEIIPHPTYEEMKARTEPFSSYGLEEDRQNADILNKVGYFDNREPIGVRLGGLVESLTRSEHHTYIHLHEDGTYATILPDGRFIHLETVLPLTSAA